MLRGKGASGSRPWLKLDYSGGNCWCPYVSAWASTPIDVLKLKYKKPDIKRLKILYEKQYTLPLSNKGPWYSNIKCKYSKELCSSNEKIFSQSIVALF